MTEWPATYERKIRYSDCDPQGIVFNGNYFTYMDDAVTDYFDALGSTWEELHAARYDIVLGHVEIDFRSSARLGETVVTGVRAIQFGSTSITYQLQIWEKATGRSVIEATKVQVVVDASTFQKRPIPPELIEAIERLQGSPVARKAPS
jgi:acyl-CoA thioester hydrolase